MEKYKLQRIVEKVMGEFESTTGILEHGPKTELAYKIHFAGTDALVQVLPVGQWPRIEISFAVIRLQSYEVAKAAQTAAAESSVGLISFRVEATKVGRDSFRLSMVFSSTAEFLSAEYLRTVFMEGFDSVLACRFQISMAERYRV